MVDRLDYLSQLVAFRRIETAITLQRRGFSVTLEENLNGSTADLIARKDNRTVVYEFKPAEALKNAADVNKLRSYAASRGFEFKLVVVRPPKTATIEVEHLEQILFDAITNPLHSDLDSLSSSTIVEGVTDIDITGLAVRRNGIEVSGSGSVEVELNYGGGRDGTSSADTYPFTFELSLDHTLTLMQTRELTVDTSSFYE